MLFEHHGRQFSTLLGSDVHRDGMYLELSATDSPGLQPLLEVFYSDEDGSLTFTAYSDQSIPLPVIEWFVAEAHRRLPPAQTASGDTP